MKIHELLIKVQWIVFNRFCLSISQHWFMRGFGAMPLWRFQMETFSALLALCEGNPPVTVGLPSQRPVMRSFDISVSCAWTNGRASNRDTGDLRCHRAHYDVTVMQDVYWSTSYLPSRECHNNSLIPFAYIPGEFLIAAILPIYRNDGGGFLECNTNFFHSRMIHSIETLLYAVDIFNDPVGDFQVCSTVECDF